MSCKCPEWIPEYQSKKVYCYCPDCDTDMISEYGENLRICRRCFCDKR